MGSGTSLRAVRSLANELRVTDEEALAFLNDYRITTIQRKRSEHDAGGHYFNLWRLELVVAGLTLLNKHPDDMEDFEMDRLTSLLKAANEAYTQAIKNYTTKRLKKVMRALDVARPRVEGENRNMRVRKPRRKKKVVK